MDSNHIISRALTCINLSMVISNLGDLNETLNCITKMPTMVMNGECSDDGTGIPRFANVVFAKFRVNAIDKLWTIFDERNRISAFTKCHCVPRAPWDHQTRSHPGEGRCIIIHTQKQQQQTPPPPSSPPWQSFQHADVLVRALKRSIISFFSFKLIIMQSL